MYQIICSGGHEIQVIGRGELGLCRVENNNHVTLYSGTYDQCVQWCTDRAIKVGVAG